MPPDQANHASTHAPRIVAIETSSRLGSIALALGDKLLVERRFTADQEHARQLLPSLADLCADQGWRPADLDECHLSIGPGSFTGLRVAVTFARHLSLAANVRLRPVPSLDVMARNGLALSPPPRDLIVILPAARGAVFAARFERQADRYARTAGPSMIPIRAILSGARQGVTILGEGAASCRDELTAQGAATADEQLWRPTASAVHALGRFLAASEGFVAPRDLVPLYIRRPEAEEVWQLRNPAKP
jgi:tRNA threonylcarbamoyladenosine biosynthesis protein TsaB